MATYQKFQSWIGTLCGGADLEGTAGTDADTLVAYLSNTPPSLTADVLKADLAEIATGSGYSGPIPLDNVGTRTLGVLTVTAKSFAVTAAGGAIGPFRYVVIADDTLAGDPLMAVFDQGTPVTIADGQSWSVLFGGTPVGGLGTLCTVT